MTCKSLWFFTYSATSWSSAPGWIQMYLNPNSFASCNTFKVILGGVMMDIEVSAGLLISLILFAAFNPSISSSFYFTLIRCIYNNDDLLDEQEWLEDYGTDTCWLLIILLLFFFFLFTNARYDYQTFVDYYLHLLQWNKDYL